MMRDEEGGRGGGGRPRFFHTESEVRGALSTLPNGAVKSVATRLGRAIVRGEYPPGSVLPFESDLLRDFGVSRTALREAVKVLAGKGLIRTARRYGTRVLPVGEWNLLDADLISWLRLDDDLTRWFMFDLVALRQIVEPEAAALAAEAASPEDVAELYRLCEGLAGPDLARVMEADIAFHRRLWCASNNLVLGQLSRPLGAMLHGYFRLEAEQVGTYWGNPDMHRAIVDAVASGRAGLARDLTLRMLDLNRRDAEAIVGGAP
jgi:GntR family transcriptional regulator, galactonate operon transcriptional repressor